ncbi:hypothetical protein AJ87_10330 [Rhizobium yanglingense]|nr:hypothetical protein AJ87_10330 [Rhizobium yanglingense]
MLPFVQHPFCQLFFALDREADRRADQVAEKVSARLHIDFRHLRGDALYRLEENFGHAIAVLDVELQEILVGLRPHPDAKIGGVVAVFVIVPVDHHRDQIQCFIEGLDVGEHDGRFRLDCGRMPVEERFDDRRFFREILIDRADRHLGGSGELRHAHGADALLRDQLCGGGEDQIESLDAAFLLRLPAKADAIHTLRAHIVPVNYR